MIQKSLTEINLFEVGHNMQYNEEEEACPTNSVCHKNWFLTGIQLLGLGIDKSKGIRFTGRSGSSA